MTDYSKYKYLKVEDIGDGIFILKLNRPERLNAINFGEGSMQEELGNIFYDFNNDSSVNAIIMTGEGRAFCSGGDIYFMAEAIEK